MNNESQTKECAEGGSRTHTPVRTTDFEDVAKRKNTHTTEKTQAKTLQLGACHGVSWVGRGQCGARKVAS